ncbi:MAG TPA: type VI secretion system baseplate subunit TssK [Longimicrobiaceae bacterium]|nr:type VI secretion system baseplate subunit TssK [Longimicrobiaceae bacterium]
MRQMQRVLWTKGVLLSPQHLQMQDRFLEDLVGFQMSSLRSFPWGFSRLEIDREALAGGSLALRAARGILPDGLPFDMPGADTLPAPKAIEDYWEPDAESLDIYLAIPENRPGGNNVSGSRYSVDVVMRRDENTGLAEKPVQVARKNFRLAAESESEEGNTTLRVARINRNPAGGFQLDPHFIPPLIDIGASEYIQAIARRLVEILIAKSSALSGTRRQRNQSLADFGVSDVANFWLLYTVNTHLPELRHLFETRGGHPADLYTGMLGLAGALTTFSATLHPRALPAYDHTDLGKCFSELDEMIRELLETVVPANHVTLPLRETESSVYAAAIDKDTYFSATRWYLAVRTDSKPDELSRKAPQLLKVSSGDRIERLIRQALPGIRIQHTPDPPGSLPLKLDYQYFLLDRSGEDWEAIRAARNLAVYVPSDFPEPRLELVILLPAGDR